MSKCIVTGGAGFIGSNLVDALISEKHEVAVIDNLYSGKEDYVNDKAEFFNVDITSDEIKEVFQKFKPDYVFHLAAQIEVPRSVEEPVFDNQVNALGSLNVFKNSLEVGVKKVIFMSTGGAMYGNCEEPAREDKLIEPISPYAIHKYAAERYLALLNEENNLNYIVLRPANIYGPRQYKGGECGVIGIFTNNHLADKESIQYGDGSKTRDYVFVWDLVNACLLSMKSEHNGVYNIGRGIEVNNLDIIKIIEEVTGKSFKYKLSEDKAGEVGRSALDYTKAKNDLGWEPRIDLEEGIRKTFEWLRGKNEG